MRLRVFVGALLFSSVAHATEAPDDRDRVLPCRPTIACTADIVPPGTFEVEAGGIYRRVNAELARALSFPVLLKQTFTQWLQLQVGSNGYSVIRGRVPIQYLDDVTVGPKFHLVDQGTWVPALAISGVASIPTFHRDGYLRTYDALFTGYATKDVGPLHADLNAGFDVWRVQNPKLQEWAALALSMNFIHPFGGMIEGYVFTDASPVTTRDGGFLFALSLSPKPWLMFDVGGDVGFYPSVRSYSAFVGMTVIPVVFWRLH